MGKSNIDYTLYLVTDSTPDILGDRDLVDVVDKACAGGVTIVQLRDKTSSTADLISIARRLLEVTRGHGVPLLINDRLDVALAVKCEGVHLGQDDADVATAREILGPDAIIGITASTKDEAIRACEGGADYLGIGTVYATQTKKNTKEIIGPRGVLEIMMAVKQAGHSIPAVCIGGINHENVQRVLTESGLIVPKVHGVAVVSAIVADPNPELAAKRFVDLIDNHPKRQPLLLEDPDKSLVVMLWEVVRAFQKQKPVSHNMTNLVVQNFAANVALCMGASPIMANHGKEAADLAKLGGALVINMGTVTPEGITNYIEALQAYNKAGRPVVFDPVGAGATSIRRAAVRQILAAGRVSVIKGNEAEIRTVAGSTDENPEQQRGVDSHSTLSDIQKGDLVRRLAQREKCVVVLTGAKDFVSDGGTVFEICNGHKYLAEVTGTGCCLGTAISAGVAVTPGIRGVIAAIVYYEIAAERAAKREEVRGPGTFVPAFLDELSEMKEMVARGDNSWAVEGARVFKHEDEGGFIVARRVELAIELSGSTQGVPQPRVPERR
ncbi:hypothetical protein QBC39DRAFT_163825 [Podospora conica]|nr:hypothetical protein QBC39DRAFT_163825 [Schizothecium conicum]